METRRSHLPPLSLAANAYRWPAEWEPRRATLLAWPHNRQTWPGVPWDELLDEYATFAAAVSRYGPVELIVSQGPAVAEAACERIAHAGGQQPRSIRAIPTDDSWVRDTAPIPLQSRRTGDWIEVAARFTAYGQRYPHAADREFAADVAGPCAVQTDLVLEGGAIDSDGGCRLLLTQQWLQNRIGPGGRQLDSSAHPASGAASLAVADAGYQAFFASLGADILCLPFGVVGDDTGGHIDDCGRMLPGGRLLLAIEPNCLDANSQALRANVRTAKRWLEDGRIADLIELPMPPPLHHRIDGRQQRLPASYANYLLVGSNEPDAAEAVLVPTFDAPQDDVACGVLQAVFPDREIVPLPSRRLIVGLGSLHCLSAARF